MRYYGVLLEMAGQYPDRIKQRPLYDGRFEQETDEVELWFGVK